MGWSAKPSGGYSITSTEGKENARIMASIMVNEYDFTLESACGAIANSINEGGLNPWRWESDKYPPTADARGCGLFGFTPYGRYLELDGSNEMNLSVTTTSLGASPNVGTQQTRIMADGTWGWVVSGWRTYWDVDTYKSLHDIWVRCKNDYGNVRGITLEQYKLIDNPYDACFVFLCCFEGPNIPNYDERVDDVEDVWKVLTDEPLPPIPPTPTKRKKLPLYMMLRRI